MGLVRICMGMSAKSLLRMHCRRSLTSWSWSLDAAAGVFAGVGVVRPNEG